jgi:outer membrane lipoprotein-sorting protein
MKNPIRARRIRREDEVNCRPWNDPERTDQCCDGDMNETSKTNKAWYRRGPVRALVPLSAAAVIAGGVALAPSLASAAPNLPAISAQQLLTKVATSKVDAYSGTVNLTTNLGIPQLPDLSGSANPLSLLSGSHTLQVAANGPEQQRVALLDQLSEYDVIHDGSHFWTYDSENDAVQYGTASGGSKQAEARAEAKLRQQAGELPATPQAAAQQLLAAISPTTQVSVGSPREVAGRSAYLLVLTPKQRGSLIGQAEIAVDSATGTPLAVTLYPVGSATPLLDLSFTSVSLSAPPASRFAFTPPKGATVTPFGQDEKPGTAKGTQRQSLDPQVLGTGWLSVLELHGVNLGELASAAAGAGSQAVQQGSSTSPNSDGGSGQLLSGAMNGYLNDFLGGGTEVSGAFGTGKVYTTSVVSVLITADGRAFLGAVTPQVLEADANARAAQ